MPSSVLIKDGDKYCGKYVATRSFKDTEVLSAGVDPVRVFTQAKEKGARHPVVFFVPEKDMVHIY